MIAAVFGTLLDKNPSQIIIKTAGGLCYEIFIADNMTLPDIGGDCMVYTHYVVREQEAYLVGFPALTDKRLFEILITAKGIGPKQGLKIIASIPASELRMAIVSGDISRLTSVKGISAKKAEQLILDLQGKLKKDIGDIPAAQIDPSNKQKTEVLLTMRALGYSDHEVKKSLDEFFDGGDHSGKNTETLVSEFLTALSK